MSKDILAGYPSQIRKLRKRLKQLNMDDTDPQDIKSTIDSLRELESLYQDETTRREDRRKAREEKLKLEKESVEEALPPTPEMPTDAVPAEEPVEEAPENDLEDKPKATESVPDSYFVKHLVEGLTAGENPAMQALGYDCLKEVIEALDDDARHAVYEKWENYFNNDPEFKEVLAGNISPRLQEQYAEMQQYLSKKEKPLPEAPLEPAAPIEEVPVDDPVEDLLPEAPVVEKESTVSKYALDDQVEPSRGTPGSRGRVMRYDDDSDMAYIHWDEGKMADRDGFGCYKGSDLRNLSRVASKDYFPGEKKDRKEREKRFQEKKKKHQVEKDKKEIYKKDKDDLGLSDKDAAPKWLQDLPTKLVDTLADPVLEMGKDPHMKEKEKQTVNPEDDDIDKEAASNQTVIDSWLARKNANAKSNNLYILPKEDGWELINYRTVIAKHLGDKIALSSERYSATTSKIQSLIKSEADAAGIPVVDIRTGQPLDSGTDREDADFHRMYVNPQYERLSALDVEADGEGIGYGGNRPGVWVSPKNDQDVSLNAQNELELNVANLKWIAKQAPNVRGWAIFNTQPINFKGQEVPAGTQVLVVKDNSEHGLSQPELEQALFDNFGKDLARVSLKVDLAILKKGSEVKPIAYDAKRRELKFVAVENDQISGWTSVDKFNFQMKKAKEHKLVVKSLHDAQAECSAGDWHFSGTGERTRKEIEEEFKKHLSLKKKEAGQREISYEKCDCGHMKFDHDIEEDGTSKCDECNCKKFVKKASKKKAVKTTKCVKCDKSCPVEDMVKNVHGAGYLCKSDATEWNKDTEASVEELQKELEGSKVEYKIIRIKSIKLLEELAEKCPDCFEKFVKFAEKSGRTIKADDVEDVITNIREKIQTTKERLKTTVEPIETEAATDHGFQKGDRVTHPNKGEGTITYVSHDQISVQWDNPVQQLLGPEPLPNTKIKDITKIESTEKVAQDPNSPPADDPGPGYKWFWNEKTMAWEKMQENAGGGAAGAPPAGGFAGGTTY